ncbi:CDP-alcohol phosphatidyltransferase [Tranquillimonas rosea]|uniref:CDP-alcohol phosphatidyltransferase n=1 Tax=Tranquillimonas rosea TaxID=641238 RepID=A0A1H9WLI4_9RHOB|nr:CDP-alcohol phosphatidyltransferase family protein [Tranquillimonas rosea]SES34750.1 CDP-alcohol phosphatidyltransferase [Tranquillimonas rosea]
MTELGSHIPDSGQAAAPPLARFAAVAVLHAALLVALAQALAAAFPVLAPGMPLALSLHVALSAAAFVLMARTAEWSFPHPRLGLCNVVTHLRGALTAALAMPMVAPGVLVTNDALAWTWVALAALVLSLDGIDGLLARRAGLVSRYGARFDVEVDSLLALVLAVLAWESGKAGALVLLLGLGRYAFVAAGAVAPWLAAPLPERASRKAVCVVQIGTLVALMAPVVTPPVSTALAAAVAVLLTWSFAIDIRWLAARR